MSLESKHFVASPTDVEEITKAVLDAHSTNTDSRASFLKALTATTQHALNSPPRQRNAPPNKIAAETRARHLIALDETYRVFYAAVDKAARDFLGPKAPAKVVNGRTNFARSAMSTIKKWITVGNDITGLAAAKVTKASLAVPAARQKATSPIVLAKRANKYCALVVLNISKLSETDKQKARDTFEALAAQLKPVLDTTPARPVHRRRSDRGLHAAA